jgi:hypothetical protein
MGAPERTALRGDDGGVRTPSRRDPLRESYPSRKGAPLASSATVERVGTRRRSVADGATKRNSDRSSE